MLRLIKTELRLSLHLCTKWCAPNSLALICLYFGWICLSLYSLSNEANSYKFVHTLTYFMRRNIIFIFFEENKIFSITIEYLSNLKFKYLLDSYIFIWILMYTVCTNTQSSTADYNNRRITLYIYWWNSLHCIYWVKTKIIKIL